MSDKIFSDDFISGFAKQKATKSFMDKALEKGIPNSHFRQFDGLYLSSIGMGTYLGEITVVDDEKIKNAVYESIKSRAINVIDTALNYRSMKSEKNIGEAIKKLVQEEKISRDEFFISTKNGYITNDGDYPGINVYEYIQRMYIDNEIIKPNDISSGYHIMHPNYIARCIEKSLSNLKLETIDLVYLHNAYESWNKDVSRNDFMEMLSQVFEVYEKYRYNNKIKYYGLATWTCFRVSRDKLDYLLLEDIYDLARKIGGSTHGFRFIQLPFNLVYNEAFFLKNQTVGNEKNLNILTAAKKLNVGVFTSVPLLQGRLFDINIPNYIESDSKILKLIQLIRSAPSIIAPLIGQKQTEHVRENIQLANIPPLSTEKFLDSIKIVKKD